MAENLSRIAAFFDFDDTLIVTDSVKLGVRYYYEKGEIPLPMLAGLMARNYLYKRNLYPQERIIRYALQFYRGKPPERFISFSGEIFKKIKPYYSKTMLEVLRFHQDMGHLIVMVSASVRFVLEPVAKDLGIQHLLCTDLEIGSDGMLTGKPLEPLCLGKNKTSFAEKFSKENGIDLSKSWFYSDHQTDLPLLEAVGIPVVVNPTVPLRKLANCRGWRIIDHEGVDVRRR